MAGYKIIHHQGDWDLSRHQNTAQRDLEYRNLVTNKEKFIPLGI